MRRNDHLSTTGHDAISHVVVISCADVVPETVHHTTGKDIITSLSPISQRITIGLSGIHSFLFLKRYDSHTSSPPPHDPRSQTHTCRMISCQTIDVSIADY